MAASDRKMDSPEAATQARGPPHARSASGGRPQSSSLRSDETVSETLYALSTFIGPITFTPAISAPPGALKRAPTPGPSPAWGLGGWGMRGLGGGADW